MNFETNKEKGRVGMALAVGYFGSHGYTVNIPMNDTQWYDLVVEKDGVFYTVQCKATGSKVNEVSLVQTGGTKGSVYDSVLSHPLDFLFCVDKEQNIYLIPGEDIRASGNTKTISLRTAPNINGQGFETYKYLIPFLHQESLKNEIPTKTVYICSKCGSEVSKKGVLCPTCANKEKSIPLEDMLLTRDELKKLIRTTPFTTIGKKYGVSDNAIRKWCDKFGLPRKASEIKKYSDAEWLDI